MIRAHGSKRRRSTARAARLTKKRLDLLATEWALLYGYVPFGQWTKLAWRDSDGLGESTWATKNGVAYGYGPVTMVRAVIMHIEESRK